jgi:hypothetical protein
MEPPPPATNEAANDPPPLYKAYFNDPTLSDLTIKLSDRSVTFTASFYVAALSTLTNSSLADSR